MKSFPEHCPSQQSNPNSNRQPDKQLGFHELSLFVGQAVWVIRPDPNQISLRVMPLHLCISFDQLGNLSVSSVIVNWTTQVGGYCFDSVVGIFLAKCRAPGSSVRAGEGGVWGDPPLGFSVSLFVPLSWSHLSRIDLFECKSCNAWTRGKTSWDVSLRLKPE